MWKNQGSWNFFHTKLIPNSSIISSQLPVDNWYDAIGDPTVADAVLDRIVHTSYQIELTGESLRKIKAKNITK